DAAPPANRRVPASSSLLRLNVALLFSKIGSSSRITSPPLYRSPRASAFPRRPDRHPASRSGEASAVLRSLLWMRVRAAGTGAPAEISRHAEDSYMSRRSGIAAAVLFL